MISNNHLSSRIGLITMALFLILMANAQETTDFSHINTLRHKRVDYPIRFTYVNRVTKWWPPADTLAQMAVPGYSVPHSYNYVALSFWTCEKGTIDTAKMWDEPIKYFG